MDFESERNHLRAMESASVEPVKPEPIHFTDEEKEFFGENAAELNYLLSAIYNNPGIGGHPAALAMYAFRMGREFQAERSDLSGFLG